MLSLNTIVKHSNASNCWSRLSKNVESALSNFKRKLWPTRLSLKWNKTTIISMKWCVKRSKLNLSRLTSKTHSDQESKNVWTVWRRTLCNKEWPKRNKMPCSRIIKSNCRNLTQHTQLNSVANSWSWRPSKRTVRNASLRFNSSSKSSISNLRRLRPPRSWLTRSLKH